MTQTYAGGAIYSPQFSLRDGAQLDAFGRVRTSQPTFIFDSQFTYDLQPLMWEQVTSGTGATVTHDSTNRCASCAFSSTSTGGKAFLQTFEHLRYQPGRSQLVEITFVMGTAVANVLKFAGLSTGTVGVELQQNGTSGTQLVLYGATTAGTQTAVQADWNVDKLDGTGVSGITLDLTKAQILVIDLQALYTGRGRVGFNIGGEVRWAHYFTCANILAFPYIQSANLPLRFGMTCTGTVSATMLCICASVKSEGGQLFEEGFPFTTSVDVTASSGSRTHALSLRPRTTFNSITNRVKFILESLSVLSGLNPVLVELCVGQALTGPSYSNVNASFSAMEVTTAGTLSGSPAIVIMAAAVGAAVGASQTASQLSIGSQRIPICLDAAGAVRANGTLTVLLTGKGGTSACTVVANWREVR